MTNEMLSNEGTCILKANETEIREAIKQLENVNIPFEIIPKFDY